MPLTFRLSTPLRAALLLTATLTVAATAESPNIQVRVGKTIERTFEQVTKAGFAYGPKQTYDSEDKETCVYLPYGNIPLISAGSVNTAFTDAAAAGTAQAATIHNSKPMSFTWRLEFDKPITGFRCKIGGYTELVLAPSCVAGVEYSIDGTTWKTLGEQQKGTRKVVHLVEDSVKVEGISTRGLLLRVYTRDGDNPKADNGPEMYLKMGLSGDPSWGDAKTTFAKAQNLVYVTTKK